MSTSKYVDIHSVTAVFNIIVILYITATFK